ncbi:hypothetical protein [Microbacterium testaceum]|uniref:hypothetical protein n=1 Tax=Microbacterium testaceum TaxID=2033 RepID=UPI001651D6E4|nr:hypothetical protein [Microbacterium testaceum]
MTMDAAPTLSPERTAEYDALFSRFVEALRTDTGLLVELAAVAAKAAAARDELAAQGSPSGRVDSMPAVAAAKQVKPVQPVQPVRPTKPVQPVRPTKPVQPVRRTKPVQPTKPPRVKLTDEERAERRREWHRAYAAKMTPEQKARYAAQTRARNAAKTPEEKAAMAAYKAAWYQANKGK